MNRKNQRGAGLIEVLVTVLILGTSLLAMGALQNRSLQFNHSAYLRSQANILAYDILDRMRINWKNLSDYDHTLGDDKPTGTALAPKDLNEWLTSVEGNLPGGEGGVDCTADNVCTVTLRWIEEADPQDGGQNGQQKTTEFTYSTRLKGES